MYLRKFTVLISNPFPLKKKKMYVKDNIFRTLEIENLSLTLKYVSYFMKFTNIVLKKRNCFQHVILKHLRERLGKRHISKLFYCKQLSLEFPAFFFYFQSTGNY